MQRKHRAVLLSSCVIAAVFVGMSLFPQWFTPYGRKEMFAPWLSPSGAHLLGTNALGYDVFTELVWGAGQTLLVGLSGSVIALTVGTAIGVLAAYGGIMGRIADGVIQISLLLPRLITLVVLAAFVGSSQWNLIGLIAAFSWAGTARTVRAKVISLNAQPFLENCVIQGYSRFHIICRHVIPNLYDVLTSRFLLGVNGCMMMESTLSFLGFGDLYAPTWGTMIHFAYQRGAFVRRAYGYLLTPGACILLVSLCVYGISLYFTEKKQIIGEES